MKRAMLLLCCLAAGAPAGCRNTLGKAANECQTSRDCDQKGATEGQICVWNGSIASGCIACLTDHECQQVAYYGAGSACQNGRCRGVCGAGGCQASSSCADIGCAQHQLCTQATASQGSSCLNACEDGYTWGARLRSCDAVDARCVQAGCAAQHRDCSVQGSTVACTSCLAGFVDTQGLCTLAPSCASLGCEAQSRSCVTDPTARCAGCKEGFFEDPTTHVCRAVKKCADLACAQLCQEALGHTDATCIQSCPTSQAINPQTKQCEGCGEMWPCNHDGETGELEPVKTLTLHCACKTKPGYFFWDAANGGTTACDADNDGWLKNGARMSVENVAQDPTLASTMKCEVRRVGSVVLESRGEGNPAHPLKPAGMLEIPMSAVAGVDSLVLYEADELDDGDRLPALGLPHYGTRALKAAELNGLTKFCVNARADFNQDGKSDAAEWNGELLPGHDSPDDSFRAKFSFFGELYRSWYEPGANGAPGKLHIREKLRSRAAAPDDRVGPTYASTAGSYWQMCERRSDAALNAASPTPTMDFAGSLYQAPGFSGLNHSSQFKCVIATSDANAKLPQVSVGDFGTAYQLNQCTANESSAPVLGITNPLDPEVTCTPARSAPSAGSVGWASVLFQAGSANVRGCLDECAGMGLLPPDQQCPGFINGMPSAGMMCTVDANNFGAHTCGCGELFAGSACDIGCVPSNFHKSRGFDLTNRSGLWMCGSTTESARVSQSADGKYVLKGKIEAPQVSRMTLTDGHFTLH